MDGQTPEIDEDGNWKIGDNETGVRAEGKDAPRFRGVFDYIGTDEGSMGIIKMNTGDWVMYIGTDRPGWTQNRVHQWTGSVWIMIPPPTESNRENAAMYLAATSEVTQGAPEAVFSFAQIRSLLADSLFAVLVRSNEFVLSEYDDGHLGNRKGAIQSSVFRSHDEATPQNPATGFRIQHDGNAEFIGVKVIDAIVNGTLVAGNVWDENGNLVNPNGRGSFAVINRNLNNYEARAKHMYLYGTTFFYPLGDNRSSAIFGVNATLREGCALRVANRVSGRFTSVASFYNAIIDLGLEYPSINPNIPITEKEWLPVCGSIIYTTNGPVNRHIILSGIARSIAIGDWYYISGMNISDNVRTYVAINPSNAALVNAENGTNTATNPITIIADLLII